MGICFHPVSNFLSFFLSIKSLSILSTASTASIPFPNLRETATRFIFHPHFREMEMPRTRSYTKRVNILKYVKVGERWRFANVVEKSGKVVRDHVFIAGRDEHHPEGT